MAGRYYCCLYYVGISRPGLQEAINTKVSLIIGVEVETSGDRFRKKSVTWHFRGYVHNYFNQENTEGQISRYPVQIIVFFVVFVFGLPQSCTVLICS